MAWGEFTTTWAKRSDKGHPVLQTMLKLSKARPFDIAPGYPLTCSPVVHKEHGTVHSWLIIIVVKINK